jgi:hypothetical protein
MEGNRGRASPMESRRAGVELLSKGHLACVEHFFKCVLRHPMIFIGNIPISDIYSLGVIYDILFFNKFNYSIHYMTDGIRHFGSGRVLSILSFQVIA